MSTLKETIYLKAPAFVQRMIFRLKSYQKYRIRTSGSYQSHYDRLIRLWQEDLDQINLYQKKRLTELLTESYDFSPWYRDLFLKRGMDKSDIQADPYGVLSKLPILEKKDLKSSLDELISNNPEHGKGMPNYTSGSTGSPMKTIASNESWQLLHAIKRRFHTTVGVPLKNRTIRFSGHQIISPDRKKPPFWRVNPYEKVHFLSLYHFNKQNLSSYIAYLNKIKPQLMDGYPSGYYVLANYILNNDLKLDFKPNAICTTAEPLTDLIRERIESAFKCKVYNQYSSSEGGIFITECIEGNLHVNIDTGVPEYYNQDGKPGKPGEVCELIMTGFINSMTPLIRYRTGDWVRLSDRDVSCNCGCKMPQISEIYGRIEDYLIDEEGLEQGMVSYRVFKKARDILKSQIIQSSPNRIKVKIVPDSQYTVNNEDEIRSRIRSILGDSIEVIFEYSDEIEVGPNGKFKTVLRKF